MSPVTLQDNPTVETFFNVVETETVALFEHLSFEFLEEFDVLAPTQTGRTRDLAELEPVVDKTFDHLVEQAVLLGLLDFVHSIDSTDVRTMPADQDASKYYDPLDIEYRVEDRIKEHSKDVKLKQSTLDETYNCLTGVERTNNTVKGSSLGRGHARGRVHARAQVFLSLCLCLVITITNHERGDNLGSTIITV